MNKQAAREVAKIEALPRDMNGHTTDAYRGMAARSLTALHRSAPSKKVQGEIEQVIDRLGLRSACRTENGALVAIDL